MNSQQWAVVPSALKCVMAAYLDNNQGKWDQYIPEFRFAINSLVQEGTGSSPAELQLGCKLNSPTF